MVKGCIGDRILECIGYPESWTEQEIEDNKRVIQEEFSKIDSHVVKAVVSRLCDKIEEPKIKKEKEEAENMYLFYHIYREGQCIAKARFVALCYQ